ncbi:ribosomal protein L41, isoform CRA_b [Rattus norvegicus]|uniref:Ribosomal protein L41, isoform CRA_b n=1 Tax=Rattus norvegicus TaxID=10116 RepID=A6KSF2_RAT|nr:ribosomal protein L41, isoform CRA_b [Rattus norvegicus]EDL84840.1 ribosomal protein L41, isoform CRA_b [Rattus norvegicus]EDL84841.1 ribosomal protein L41, isoform CRA_b [Rattus norvegicus]
MTTFLTTKTVPLALCPGPLAFWTSSVLLWPSVTRVQ